MRNVVKGFEVSHMALPKVHEVRINQGFNNYHAPALHRMPIYLGKPQQVKRVSPIGGKRKGRP